MDSINRNQTEDTRQDLHGPEAVKKIQEIVDRAKSCFFCTAVATSETDGARPMSVRRVDGQGNLWFLSANDSHKNEEMAQDPRVSLFFQGSPHSDFLHLKGLATISKDKAKIRELWEAPIQTWFTEGIDDPRITVVKVEPTEGYYWDNKHGDAVAGIKIMIGAALKKTMDDSVEGTIRPS